MIIEKYDIYWDEQGDDLNIIDCDNKEVELFGEDDAGNEYTAVAWEECGEIVDVNQDSIECIKSFTAFCVPKWAKNKKQLYKDIEEK